MFVYLNALSTILAMLTFFAIVWWAFSQGRQAANQEASMLPFALPDETHLHQIGGARS
jgi:cytochrome c oxidase cbb3-type subunit 4